MNVIEIWTDGACEPNPGIGGWGWVRSDGTRAYGGELETTNNRMELIAIIAAMRSLAVDKSAVIYSDSQYCVKGLTIWRKGWQKKNWMRQGQPMPNRDLWLAAEQELKKRPVVFRWVKGHADNKGNIEADSLAQKGRLKVIGGMHVNSRLKNALRLPTSH